MTKENKRNKKITVSIGLILASMIYVLYRNTAPMSAYNSFGDTLAVAPSSNSYPPKNIPTFVSKSFPGTTHNASFVASDTVAVSNPMHKMISKKRPAGQYTDGSYTGNAEDAYYGTIQVQAIIQNGALADVQFLQHPNDRSTSRYINGYAMPILKQEAISAQNANVNIVSGATDSSQAFQQSLASALSQAKS